MCSLERTDGRPKIWINGLLFVLTALATFVVGLTWSLDYVYAEAIGASGNFEPTMGLFFEPAILALSFLYVVVLLTILVGHELGHYLTCRRYGIAATLPYFIPAPTLVGTLGAFIKIKSPITRKHQLFDIGAAGPLTGFLLALPALFVGLAFSKVIPAVPHEEAIFLGEPLIFRLVASLVMPNVPAGSDVILHPVGFAGWVGILVTGFNLFPLGQLDGGHIAFALLGGKARTLSKILMGVFVALGFFFWIGWFVWVLLILVLGLKHPRIQDEGEPLTPLRKLVSVLIIVIFALSFIPDPIRGYDLIGLLRPLGLPF